MRTNEERRTALHQRAAEIKRENRQRRVRVIQRVGGLCCLAVVIVFSILLPDFTGETLSGIPSGNMSASVFSTNSSLEHVVIGVVAFMLGVTFSVFCFRLNKWRKEKEDEDE